MTPVAYVLAKNEEPNIARCVAALRALDIPVIVLDSGSLDRTRDIAASLGATVESYRYVSHAEAYRYISVDRSPTGTSLFVLDADMVVSRELVEQATRLLEAGADVVEAPVRMCWNGAPLRYGSLYPPKPILFRGGRDYFEPVGHGERLRPNLRVARTTAVLIHDDRKAFSAYLESQVRYARNFVNRTRHGEISRLDRIRGATPILIAAVPMVSYLLRGGFLDGWSGLGYALDRVIAEAIMVREAVAARVAVNDDERAPR
jgi:glycosyltransferase involved in cell wall biosynthesis